VPWQPHRCAEFVKKAVEADNKGDYPEAYTNYVNALDAFAVHLKYEKNPAAREAITAKVKDYLERAEYLKKVVDNQPEVTKDGGTAQGGTRNKGKEVCFGI
jgi:vacuolar protein-sorting-associated protein 4